MNCTITSESFNPRRERERTRVFHRNKSYEVSYTRTILTDGTQHHELKYSSSVKVNGKSLGDAIREFKDLVDKLRL